MPSETFLMLRSPRSGRLEARTTATTPLPDARPFVGCEMEGGHIQRNLGWLWIVGFFGLLASANAQTASPPATTMQFDGTYAFVSATKVNETSMTTTSTRLRPCWDITARPLTIANGRAKYSGFGRWGPREFDGTAGQQGELTMRSDLPDPHGRYLIMVNGRVDSNGAVRARQMAAYCSYELTWQKTK